MEPMTVALTVGVVLAAGAITGVAGFGFALAGTAALAGPLGPRTAVAFMILPILAANLSLVRELDREALDACTRRFAPFVASALVGTIVGMAVLDAVPERPLAGALGVLTLGFVAVRQDAVDVPLLESAEERCFVETGPAMVGVGGVSGVVFGATNVGVQMVAYIRSCGLRGKTFAGVVGLVFLGMNASRVVVAGVIDLYPEGVLVLSVAAMVPAAVGVGVGKRIRPRVGERWRARIVLGLLVAVGVRLLTSAV
ncbi:sulfite exporter TauE/SafE family protein [Haladaptatus sp. F3-133]|uniref:Probable membrane transporter protein n=1 Tax=Halorutilus salinus TaxID=2487751 RepID=A0A9Q4C1V0_9EURY|nr:sulfite exporter TauE/SafE family protein [Halorutilus salinus]